MKFEPYVIREIVQESENVKTFKITKEDGSVPDYKPGHFFLLRLVKGDGKPIQRSYSVASLKEEGMLWLGIKLEGVFTNMLWKLKEGDKVEADGPYGIFLLREGDEERVFIGGGVGVTPLRPMIMQSIRDGVKCHLFHSAKSLEGLTYFAEIKKMSVEKPLFLFYPSITGEAKPEKWGGFAERISVPLLKSVLGSLEKKTFYLCGSKEMAGSLAAALLAEGVPKDRVKKDEWG